jgi:AraC-like DNA-binding protein
MATTIRVFPRSRGLPADLRIYGIGISESMRPGVVQRPSGTGRYLAICFHTPAVISASGRRTQHPAHRLVIWPPGREHAYGHELASWNHSWMAFDGPGAQAAIAAARIPLDTVIPTGIGLAQEHFARILGEMLEPSRPDAAIIRGLVGVWLLAAARAMSDRHAALAVPDEFLSLRRHLEEHCGEDIRLPAIARRTRLSRWHLCRAYRRWFGVAPMEDLQRIRMQRAGLLARDPTLAVGEIARRCGYPDAFHFSKQFKKHYGSSPSAFRRSLWGESR